MSIHCPLSCFKYQSAHPVGNPLVCAVVSVTLIGIKVLQQILKTKRLFVALRRYRAVQIQKLVVRKSQNVVVHVTNEGVGIPPPTVLTSLCTTESQACVPASKRKTGREFPRGRSGLQSDSARW